MVFVRKVGAIPIPVPKGGSTSLEVVLLPYSHRTYNENKKVVQLWTTDRMPDYHAL
jgi:hypothetical protein